MMRTLNVSISESEYQDLGLTNDKISFAQFVDILNKDLACKTLEDSLLIAEKHGLSEMTMDEITQEVKAAKKDAKNAN